MRWQIISWQVSLQVKLDYIFDKMQWQRFEVRIHQYCVVQSDNCDAVLFGWSMMDILQVNFFYMRVRLFLDEVKIFVGIQEIGKEFFLDCVSDGLEEDSHLIAIENVAADEVVEQLENDADLIEVDLI